jgi:hypothetical protein
MVNLIAQEFHQSLDFSYQIIKYLDYKKYIILLELKNKSIIQYISINCAEALKNHTNYPLLRERQNKTVGR